MNRQTLTVVILLLLLLGALGFIGYNYWKANKITEQNNLLETGAQYGYQQATVQIAAQVYQQAATCSPVPVNYNNQTVYMIAIGCPGTEEIVKNLQAAAQQNQVSAQ